MAGKLNRGSTLLAVALARLALRSEALADASDWIESQRERWERLVGVVGE